MSGSVNTFYLLYVNFCISVLIEIFTLALFSVEHLIAHSQRAKCSGSVFVCTAGQAKKKKKKKSGMLFFLFGVFDLSHLSEEHCITSDHYQGIHTARYHTIHIYCLWFKPFSCSSNSCLKKYHTLFPNAVKLCENKMLHFGVKVFLLNVQSKYTSKRFVKDM